MEKHKRGTINHIARLAQLPAATVRYALQGLPGLDNDIKKQVLAIAAEMGYVIKEGIDNKKNGTSPAKDHKTQPRDITMADIAKKLNISVATVSRAINGSEKIGQQTKEKVLSTAREFGFAVNTDAKKLRVSALANASDGEKKITIHDIAAILNVSVSTVSRCYSPNGDVSAKTRERVLRTAEAMGFTLQENARRLRGSR